MGVQIPIVRVPATDRVWLMGAHGGAGCSTIYHAVPQNAAVFADAGRALPVCDVVPARVIVVARGDGFGLQALRDVLCLWHDGGFYSTQLLGVAVRAPVKRTPIVLRKGARLVSSVAPRLWLLPYMDSLLLDGWPEPAQFPRAYQQMIREITGVDRHST